MDDKKQLKIIRYGIITMLIGTVVGIAIDEILHIHNDDEIQLNSQESQTSQSSQNSNSLYDSIFNQEVLTYVDEKLGFSITKPDDEWIFNSDLKEITQINMEKFEANGFLGGLYVEKNGDKSVLVTVFDIPNKENFSLENYVEEQISQFEENELDYKIIIKEISPDKKTVKLGIETDFGNGVVYGEQILRIDNEKFFMLQFTGPSFESIDNAKLKEIRSIMDSFFVFA